MVIRDAIFGETENAVFYRRLLPLDVGYLRLWGANNASRLNLPIPVCL